MSTTTLKRPVAATSRKPRKRGRRHPLGPFSYIIMRAIDKLPNNQCYGSYLVDLAQVFIALSRLEDKSFVKSKDAPAPTGSNRTVKVYTITPIGRAVMEEAGIFYRAVTSLDPR
jgi:DNA-binding PadR family transcriptional regulator